MDMDDASSDGTNGSDLDFVETWVLLVGFLGFLGLSFIFLGEFGLLIDGIRNCVGLVIFGLFVP